MFPVESARRLSRGRNYELGRMGGWERGGPYVCQETSSDLLFWEGTRVCEMHFFTNKKMSNCKWRRRFISLIVASMLR